MAKQDWAFKIEIKNDSDDIQSFCLNIPNDKLEVVTTGHIVSISAIRLESNCANNLIQRINFTVVPDIKSMEFSILNQSKLTIYCFN